MPIPMPAQPQPSYPTAANFDVYELLYPNGDRRMLRRVPERQNCEHCSLYTRSGRDNACSYRGLISPENRVAGLPCCCDGRGALTHRFVDMTPWPPRRPGDPVPPAPRRWPKFLPD